MAHFSKQLVRVKVAPKAGAGAMDSSRKLQQELALANRRIIEGHGQIGRQRKLVLRLDATGHDATDAKGLLLMMEWVLEAIVTYRDRIRQEVSNAVGEER
jgi:hypothetical protein